MEIWKRDRISIWMEMSEHIINGSGVEDEQQTKYVET